MRTILHEIKHNIENNTTTITYTMLMLFSLNSRQFRQLCCSRGGVGRRRSLELSNSTVSIC